MNNTALRAEAQSANNTHMVFANEEHEMFYYEKLEQARYQDCYHKALIYILGISEDTRNYFSQIYDIKSGSIKTERLHQRWQTSGSVRVVRLAFNLYTDGTPSVDDYESRDDSFLLLLSAGISPKHGLAVGKSAAGFLLINPSFPVRRSIRQTFGESPGIPRHCLRCHS